jgi:hypothetical protein
VSAAGAVAFSCASESILAPTLGLREPGVGLDFNCRGNAQKVGLQTPRVDPNPHSGFILSRRGFVAFWGDSVPKHEFWRLKGTRAAIDVDGREWICTLQRGRRHLCRWTETRREKSVDQVELEGPARLAVDFCAIWHSVAFREQRWYLGLQDIC